jgi:hypothetical protein
MVGALRQRRSVSLALEDLEAYLAVLASMRGAERGFADHWVVWLAGARRLDLHSDCGGCWPLVLQVTLEASLRRIAASV